MCEFCVAPYRRQRFKRDRLLSDIGNSFESAPDVDVFRGKLFGGSINGAREYLPRYSLQLRH